MFSNKSVKQTKGRDNEKKSISLSKQFIDDFQSILPKVIDENLSKLTFLDIKEIKIRIKEMSMYYSLKRKPILGELMLHAYEILNGPIYPDKKTQQQAYVLACVLELGLSHLLFIDDTEDDGKVRCGKPCWHLLPDVGSLAMNDSNLLRSFIHELLRHNFHESLFLKLINFVNKIYFVLAIGQHMDVTLARKRNYNDYTIDKYCLIAEKKLLFAIKAPIVFALYLVNKATDDALNRLQDICREIAILSQIKNDVADFNCDGLKSSTDIQKAKCSWLAAKALEKCNEEQRNIFIECYGSWDACHVKKIRELYEELQLSKLFVEEQQARYNFFLRKVNELPSDITPGAKFYHKLFKIMTTFKI